jgi:hypothetical protein
VVRKYPLEPVAKVREARTDDAGAALAGALRGEERAAADRRVREEERKRHEEAVRATESAEQARLERGELTAADLLHGAAYQAAAAVEQKRLAGRVTDAAQKEREARVLVDQRRASLARAKQESEVVERHRDEWQAEGVRAELAAEELAAEEFHVAKPREKRMPQ